MSGSAAGNSPSRPGSPGVTQVGTLGAKESLVFEGNVTFSADEILAGLRWRMDYFLASHPAAPLGGYTAALEALIGAGYQHNGFAQPEVRATIDSGAGRVRVTIKEGTRYKTGRIVFKGAKPIQDPAVQQQIRDALDGLATPGLGSTDTNGVIAMWPKDGYVPFDEDATRSIGSRVGNEFRALQFYNPKLQVSIVPDPASKTAELVLDMVDEGLRGTISHIAIQHWTGEHTNTDEEIVSYLGLKEGMNISPTLLGDITNRLYQSGRFMYHEASLVPQTELGKFKLELHLEESDRVPPLRQQLSTNELVFLKLADWLSNLNTQREDLVLSSRLEQPEVGRIDLELLISRNGLLFSARRLPTNAAPQLLYAASISGYGQQYYSGWRQHKLVLPGRTKFEVSMAITPNRGKVDKNRFNFFMGAGISSKESSEPLHLKLAFPPVKFLESAQEVGTNAVVKDGVFEADFRERGLQAPATLQVDPGTGRLLLSKVETHTNDLSWSFRLTSESGAFERSSRELTAASADWRDDYVQDRGFSSWAGFMLCDVVESGVLESAALGKLLARLGMSDTNILSMAHTAAQTRQSLAQLKTALGQPDLIHCLTPLEDKFAALKGKPDQKGDGFKLPLPKQQPGSDMQKLMAIVGVWVIDKADTLWPRGSWPWTLTREAMFTLSGASAYTEAELEKLLADSSTGPLGSGAAGLLVAAVNAPLAEKFARRSLDQLTVTDLHKDLVTLLAPETMAGQVLADFLGTFSHLNDDSLRSLGALLGGNSTNFLQETAQLLRAGSNQPPAVVIRPAIERHWEPLLKPRLEKELKDLLAKVGTPKTPADACKRAQFIFEKSQRPEDLQTAVQLLRTAAESGYAPAQAHMGNLHREGKVVTRDYAESLRWFMLAAQQNHPHAGCQVAELYFNGEGVERNVETAMNYYAREASNRCVRAQLRLAQCLEQQTKTAQALEWYRQAATNGSVNAQTALGDRLTDGLTFPVDNAEAYLWYSVAGERGNRVAGVSARRLKAKLSPAQLQAADEEIKRLARKLEESSRRGE